MKSAPFFASFLSLICLVTAAAGATPPDTLVIADAIPWKGIQIHPEPDKPIYYYLYEGMERDIGDSLAGMTPADPAVIRDEVIKALASQNYLQTSVGGPKPQIVVTYSWGQASREQNDIPGTDADTGEATTTTVDFGGNEMKKLVGYDKAQKHLLTTSEGQEVTDNYNSGRVYIFVAALDADAMSRKEKKLVWRTRMSIDSLRDDLPSNLNRMLADAAPYFGRSFDRPITVDTDVRRASVKLGELKFIDEPAADANQAPAADSDKK